MSNGIADSSSKEFRLCKLIEKLESYQKLLGQYDTTDASNGSYSDYPETSEIKKVIHWFLYKYLDEIEDLYEEWSSVNDDISSALSGLIEDTSVYPEILANLDIYYAARTNSRNETNLSIEENKCRFSAVRLTRKLVKPLKTAAKSVCDDYQKEVENPPVQNNPEATGAVA